VANRNVVPGIVEPEGSHPMTRVLIDYPHEKAGTADQAHCATSWSGPSSDGVHLPARVSCSLGGALDFAYVRDATLTPPVYLVGRGADMELDLLHRLGAQTEFLQSDDPALSSARQSWRKTPSVRRPRAILGPGAPVPWTCSRKC
jgi:hypothetical protein